MERDDRRGPAEGGAVRREPRWGIRATVWRTVDGPWLAYAAPAALFDYDAPVWGRVTAGKTCALAFCDTHAEAITKAHELIAEQG